VSSGFYYPLLIISAGIGICIITTCAIFIVPYNINTYNRLEWSIKLQLIISSILLIPTIALISIYCLPKNYNIGDTSTIGHKENNAITMVCPLLGLISGLIIGISTEYYFHDI
jgi:Na+/H+-translocating membrane pyrophosphatase